MTKIGKIVSYLDFGGVERVVELAALELFQRKKDEVIIIVLGNGGSVSKKLRATGIQVIILDKNPKIPNIRLIFALYKILKRDRFQVIHTVGAEANFHGLIAAFLARIKVRVGEEIGFPNHGIFWIITFNLIYRFAHKVIVVSKSVQDKLIKKNELKLNKSIVIYNPAYICFKGSLKNRTSEKLIFVMVSRLTAIKNIANTIKAFKQIISSTSFSTELWVIGDGEEKSDLENLVNLLNLKNFVHFPGYQPEVSMYLKNSDVFLIPSFSEGSSVALVEAMLCGLPSIVTKVGGTREVIGNSNSALYIDPNDFLSIYDAMIEFLMMDQLKRKELGQRARNFAVKNFSPQNYIDNVLHVYESLK